MDVQVSGSRDFWLVKVPKYMAAAWKEASQNSELGKLQVPKDGNGAVKFISDPKLSQSNIPSEHKLTLNQLHNQRMVILASNTDSSPSGSATQPAKISFEGSIKHRGELRPPADLSYMKLKASSIKEAAKPARTTRILDKAVNSYKPRGAVQLANEADFRRRKEESKKMIREDKEVVQSRLFRAFEKQQYYNIKDLVKLTNQTAPYLKEILKEICNYSSKSAHRNMWELKPEYRHYKNPSE